MERLRARLTWLTVFWLVCQATSLAVAPFALCCREMVTAAAVSPNHVADGDEADASCPLHAAVAEHDSAAGATGAGDDCVMRSTCAPSDPVLLSLLGTVAVLPVAATASIEPVGEMLSLTTPVERACAPVPEAPPPRVSAASPVAHNVGATGW